MYIYIYIYIHIHTCIERDMFMCLLLWLFIVFKAKVSKPVLKLIEDYRIH